MTVQFVMYVTSYDITSCSRVSTAVTLAWLLGQAVQSGDRALLEELLKVRKEVIICQTIRRLPVALVVPLLQQVTSIIVVGYEKLLTLSLSLSPQPRRTSSSMELNTLSLF